MEVKSMEGKKEILNVAAYEPRSLVNGPGVRAVLWVQGCGKRCPDCFNPDFQKREGGRFEQAKDVIGWIEAAQGIEGVTFSGGEPFDQAGPLAIVAKQSQAMGLGILVFTGYTWEDLQEREDADRKALLSVTDMLIAGPYERGIPSSHPLLGSANQEMIFLTRRYREYPFGRGIRTEFRISPDGAVRVTGLKVMNITGAYRT